MGKLAALSVLVAVAFMVYFFKPSTQLQVTKTVEPINQGEPVGFSTNTKANTSQELAADVLHQHTDNHQAETEIPQYIKDQIESQRLPASELTVKKHPDGSSSIDLKGQFQHVPVAILGEDGKVEIVETRVEPRAD